MGVRPPFLVYLGFSWDNKSNMVQTCQHVFRETDAIIIREYNSGPKLSDRTYVILQKIVIRKNAKSWGLHLRDVG